MLQFNVLEINKPTALFYKELQKWYTCLNNYRWHGMEKSNNRSLQLQRAEKHDTMHDMLNIQILNDRYKCFTGYSTVQHVNCYITLIKHTTQSHHNVSWGKNESAGQTQITLL